MNGMESYLILMLAAAIGVGFFGALIGVGGGILLTPILTLVFGVPVYFAMGASIVSVIGTSSGAASAFLESGSGLVNFKTGTLFNLMSTVGGIIGAVLTIYLIEGGMEWANYITFGLVLLFCASDVCRRQTLRRRAKEDPPAQVDYPGAGRSEVAGRLGLEGEYYDSALKQRVNYSSSKVASGSTVMFAEGLLSGSMGIGGVAINVIGLNSVMKFPFKVSAATSNFMIGVTSAASAAIFYIKGYVNLMITGPVAVGVVLGSILGAKLASRARPSLLTLIFVIVVIVSGVQMVQKGLTLA